MREALVVLFLGLNLIVFVILARKLKQATRSAETRWRQGRDIGFRNGWYAAADRLLDDEDELEARGVPQQYLDGWEDAGRRLNTYWDYLDKGTGDQDASEQGEHGEVDQRPGDVPG